MPRTRALLFACLTVLSLLLASFGCSLLQRDDATAPAGTGGYIQVQIRAPAAFKGITVTDFEVTALQVLVRDPAGEVLKTIDWQVAQGPQSYMVPVKQLGEHRLEVTHFGQRDGQMVQATESAAFNIRAMVITVIDVVPGSIGVIDVGGEEPPAPDLTGYWDAILTPVGGTPNPPHLLYLKQTGSSLNGSDAISGTVEGMGVTFVVPDFGATYVGTIGPDDTITGTIEMWGQTLEAELRRSALDFGTFALGGLIDLNTDRGLGSRGEDRISYRLDFHLRAGTLQGAFSFWNVTPLLPGTYAVVPTRQDNPGPGEVGAWFFEAWENEYAAESGILTITRNDSTGASGSFAVQFEGGNSLNGSFELNPPTYSGGVVAITGGYWNATEVMPETASGLIWGSGMEVDWADCNISYLDEDRNVGLSFGPNFGPVAAGTYLVPDQLWVHVSQRYDDGSEFWDQAASGTLVITRFEEGAGIAGYFENMVFSGGALTGSFDVSFELSNYQ